MLLTAKDIRQYQMEPQAPSLIDVTNVHGGQSTMIDTIDHVQWQQDRDG
jgi:hypothetical protein